MTELVDGGCFLGHDLETGFRFGADALLAEMERLGTGRALVGSYRAIYQDVREGNREIARLAAELPTRVVPLAVLHPAFYGESPDKLIAWLKNELGMRALALFNAPSYYPVDWDTPAVRAIGEAAARLGLPLQAGIVDDADLGGVGRAWGHLTVPVQVRWMRGHRYKMIASEIAAARRYPALRFDVGNLTSTGAVKLLAREIGAERLFFASNSPHNIADCAHALVRECGVEPAARARIAGGTLCADLALPPAPESGEAPVAAAWQALCARPKVDIHWHQDHWNLGEPALSAAEQLATFDRFGHERVLVYSILALNHDLEAGNALTAEWIESDPRVFGMIVVSPREREASLREIARYADHPRFLGLKAIQDVFGIGLDDDAFAPLLQEAARRRLPLIAHMPGMDRAAQRHPEVTFIATHGNWGRARRFERIENVHFDLSTGHALREETQLGRFVEMVGPERILYGSDGQLVSPAWTLAKIQAAALADDVQEKMFRGNAYRLFPRLKESRK